MRKSRYLVVAEEVCPQCKGTGYRTHPDWEQLYKELGPYYTLGEAARWFNAPSADLLPPEEVPCDECGGNGLVRREASLTEVLLEEKVEHYANRLHSLMYADTRWIYALAAVLTAAYTGDPDDGESIISGMYSWGKTDEVWGVLEKAARLGRKALLEWAPSAVQEEWDERH